MAGVIVAPRGAIAATVTDHRDDDAMVSMWVNRSNSVGTRLKYEREWEVFRAHVRKPIGSVTMADLQEYRDHCVSRVKANTARRSISSIRSLLSFCHRTGYTQFNVGVAVTPPAEESCVIERILSVEDVEAMVSKCTRSRDAIVIVAAYETGARLSELRGIRQSDLNQRSDGAYQVLLRGKGGKKRTVLVSMDLYSGMLGLLLGAGASEKVFKSGLGRAISEQSFRDIFKDAGKRAGVSNRVTPHWFRHTHATHAIDGGCPLHVLQQSLGHSNLAVTGRYLHVRPKESSGNYLGRKDKDVKG